MKLFSQGDGVFDVIAKLATSAGVIFGVWAYFHTIHPVFEKEIELQSLRVESQDLSSEVRTLNESVDSLRKEKAQITADLASLGTQQVKIKAEIYEREQQLKKTIASLKNASDAAVLNKLQYYSDKLTSAYIVASMANKGAEFDVLAHSRKILATHSPETADEYSQKAYVYFKRYVESYDGEPLKGDRVIEFAVSLFFDYKIEMLKKRASQSE